MSHNASHIIIDRVAPDGSATAVLSSRVVLRFPAGTSIEDRLKVVRRAERLLDRLEHDDDPAD